LYNNHINPRAIRGVTRIIGKSKDTDIPLMFTKYINKMGLIEKRMG
jgi:hypothetical protein